jgi:uncharacterized protein YciI
MFFLVTGKDGTDAEALDRRMANRPDHLENSERLRKEGKLILGAAMLDDSGKMIGSIMVMNFDDRPSVDQYLDSEPYVKGKVWQQITVQNLAIGNAYLPEVLRK